MYHVLNLKKGTSTILIWFPPGSSRTTIRKSDHYTEKDHTFMVVHPIKPAPRSLHANQVGVMLHVLECSLMINTKVKIIGISVYWYSNKVIKR